jgi:hypothetical protein
MTHACTPSPCDPNSQCKIYGNQVAICEPCRGYDCRPECLSSAECPFNKACIGQRCMDPCPGSCGVNALCMVVNHNPVCSCPSGYVGNPFEHCSVPASKFSNVVRKNKHYLNSKKYFIHYLYFMCLYMFVLNYSCRRKI